MKIGKVSDWTSALEKKIFGVIKLKQMQIAILNCNKDHDVIVNLPTGFGKSLLYQYPASKLVKKCIVIFVPLKALLWDSLKQAQLHNLTASELELNFIKEYQKNEKLPQLLFLTPERFFMNKAVYSFMDMLYYNKFISMIVIDEAHCISEWGSDFRPDYARLSELRTTFPDVRILAMSATIPPQARNDLVKKLQIVGSYYFQSSSNRPNLIYEIQSVDKCSQVPLKIMDYIKSKGLCQQSGIIYCQTIKNSEQVFDHLKKLKVDCCLFHSKLSEKVRSQNFENFMHDKVRIIVATICFGMGVNKKNIRFVINAGVSLSAQNYYQESGRAGRDGEISYCLLLTYNLDINPLKYLIHVSAKTIALQKRRLFKLGQIKQYAKSQECRKRYLFKLLGEDFSVQDCQKTCDFCKSGGLISYVEQKFDYTSKALKLIEHIRCQNLLLTKRQLICALKGNLRKRWKGSQQKFQFLNDLFKGQKSEIIQPFVQSLINLGLLCSVMTNTGGKFNRMVQYLKPCTKSQLAKHKTIMISVRQKKSLPVENRYTKNVDFIPSNRISKFGSYLDKKKTKSQQQLDKFQFTTTTEPQLPPSTDDTDLKEIKMVSMGLDYQKFFQELYHDTQENLQDKPMKSSSLEGINVDIDKKLKNNRSLQAIDADMQGQYENQQVDIDALERQYGSDPQITMQNVFISLPNQSQLQQPIVKDSKEQEQQSREFDELLAKIKKVKEGLKQKEQEKQQKKQAVVRKSLIDKYYFI